MNRLLLEIKKKIENILVMLKGVSMSPFRIHILNGRKRQNFVKAIIYSTISKFNILF